MMDETAQGLGETGPKPSLEQTEFMGFLEGIPPGNVHEKPDFSAHLSHDGDIPRFDSEAPVLGSGLYLQVDALKQLHGPENDGGTIKFSPQPLAEIGRTEVDSRNHTFMGMLSLESTSGDPGLIPVVVKPITLVDGQLDHSLQETAMLDFGRQLGLPVPEIIGVW